MASGQAQDSAESQPLLGAAIANDMDLTDISFNDFFSFTDDVGETLDREMHHSLFGDSGLGMDLGPLMGPPAELDHGADQLLPDIATQLFDEVAAAHDALPEGAQCELLVKHVRRTSQSAPPEPLPLIEEVSVDSPDVQSVVSDTPSSQADSPLRQALWDHSYCSRGNSGASSPAGDADTVCKVPGYLGAAPAPSPLLEKVPPYVQGSAAPPSRKKLSLSEYRQRRSALSSRSGSPDQPPPPPLAEREVEVASLPPPPPPVGAPLAPAAAPAAAPAPGQVLAKDAAAAPAVAPAAAPVRSRASSPPRGYRLDATSPSGRADSDRSSSRRGGRFSTGSASSSASSSRSSSASRCRSPDDPLRYSPSDFDIVSRPSRPTRPGRRRSLSRSRSRSPRVRSRSPLSRGCSPRSRSRSKSRSRSRRRPADSRSRRQQREERERERERRRREEARREERRRQEELANQRDAVDRKVVYVNGLAPTVTRDDLRKMFSCFGVITKIRIKERDPSVDLYREQRDGCYAFITYVSHSAAVAAQAHGSARFPHLEVKFGGRREFCLDQYADQDADLNNPAYYGVKAGNDSALDFDTLLQMEMQRVKQAGQAKKVV